MNESDDYMLHVHYMNEDDYEIMILNIYICYMWTRWWNYVECMFFVHHTKLSHDTIMLWFGSYDDDDDDDE
jgi:hypothetical protein